VYLVVCEQSEKHINVAGKELFMIDHTLDDSDVKFLEEGNTGVLYLMPFIVRSVSVSD